MSKRFRAFATLSAIALLITSGSAPVVAELADEPPAASQPTPAPRPLQGLERWPDQALADDLLWQGDASSAQLQLLTALAHSLTYLDTPAAATAYADYAIPTITRDRVRRSLRRFRTLLLTSDSPAAFD
ncbi:MAG: hypothetical protein AAFO87_16010, partial [Cyanobacteria bacterium J06607_6]